MRGRTELLQPANASFESISLGTTPATAGAIRLSNLGFVNARNAANTLDIGLMALDGSDVMALGFAQGTVPSAIHLNYSGGDVDVKILSDDNANHFVSDGDAYNVGAFGFGMSPLGNGLTAYIYVDNPAFTATANQSAAKLWIGNSAALTVPAGTASRAASLRVREPNLTATGTIFDAYTVIIDEAPTEGTRNGALWVAAGSSVFCDAALATTATTGFVHIATCAGTPTGVVATTSGAALVVDSTNHKLYARYGGAWHDLTGT